MQPFDHGVGDATAVGGGALYLLKSDAILQNCVLHGNSDSRRGGAIGGAYSTLVMSQCYFHDNMVHVRGSRKKMGREGRRCLQISAVQRDSLDPDASTACDFMLVWGIDGRVWLVQKRPGAVKFAGRKGAATGDVPEGVGGAISLTQASLLMCSNTSFRLNRAMVRRERRGGGEAGAWGGGAVGRGRACEGHSMSIHVLIVLGHVVASMH